MNYNLLLYIYINKYIDIFPFIYKYILKKEREKEK